MCTHPISCTYKDRQLRRMYTDADRESMSRDKSRYWPETTRGGSFARSMDHRSILGGSERRMLLRDSPVQHVRVLAMGSSILRVDYFSIVILSIFSISNQESWIILNSKRNSSRNRNFRNYFNPIRTMYNEKNFNVPESLISLDLSRILVRKIVENIRDCLPIENYFRI